MIPESTAALYSIPVATIGASVFNNGTACLCMFEPINVLLTSSCSMNGIIVAAIEAISCGDTST